MATQVLTITEAAAALGVSVKTVRRYEANGVIPPATRAQNGYRIYTQQDIKRLQKIVSPMPRRTRRMVLEAAS